MSDLPFRMRLLLAGRTLVPVEVTVRPGTPGGVLDGFLGAGSTVEGLPVRSLVLGRPPLVEGAVVSPAGATPPFPVPGWVPGGAAGLIRRRPDGSGQVQVDPAPDPAPVPCSPPPRPPAPTPAPAQSEDPPPPWAAAVLPAVSVLPVVWWTGEPIFLALAAAAPAVAVVQWGLDRRRAGRERARRHEEHRRRCADRQQRWRQTLDRHRMAVAAAHPPPATVLATVAGPSPGWWARCPDVPGWLELRIGTAVDPGGRPPSAAPSDRTPVVVRPKDLPLGVCGPRDVVQGVGRALLCRASALHSPVDLRVEVRAGPTGGRDWGWSAWLPQARAGNGVRATLSLVDLTVTEAGPAPGPGPETAPVYLAGAEAHLPRECRSVLRCSPAGTVLRDGAGRCRPVIPDLVDEGTALRFATAAAPLRHRGRSGAGGGTTRLSDLVELVTGVPGDDATAVVRRWQGVRDLGPIPVGLSEGAPWYVDLVRDGPHALVAGTTGSGKSELLVTLVAGAALMTPPSLLHLLLVDYKGGDAFGPLAGLPHVAALLTDLDARAATRALSSLRAEVRRRERVRASGGTVPRLLIVVDEFRVLAEELPSLLDGLVRVASVGRSLGIHLVLATQRPGGVVSAEVRSNTNLRIALRVLDRADSEDVLGSADAAGLPPGLPGTGLARIGAGPLTGFRTARAPGGSGAGVPSFRPLEPVPGLPSELRPHAAASPAPDPVDPVRRARLGFVAVLREAASVAGLPVAEAPWCAPLPGWLGVAELPGHGHAGTCLALGAVDRPEEQERVPLCWDPASSGGLAVAGAPGSGRSGAVRAVATAAGRPGSPVHLHVVHGTDDFADLHGVPWTGTVVPAGDLERVGRLVRMLTSGRAPVTTVLAVDGWEDAVSVWEAAGHPTLADEVVALGRRGRRSGVALMATGGRAVTAGALGAVLPHRLLLRPADRTELMACGVSAGDLPAVMPPGRVVVPGPGGRAETGQLLAPVTGPDDPAPVPAGPWPARLVAPPEHGAKQAPPAPAPSKSLLVVGIGVSPDGTRHVPVGLSLGPDRGWLVTGPPGSGRSTVLAALGTGLLRAGHRLVVVAAPGSPVERLGDVGAVVLRAPEDLASPGHVVRAGEVVIVDDLSGPATELEHLLAGRGPGPVLVAGAELGAVCMSYSGTLGRLRAGRRGVVTGTSGPAIEREVFGIPLPRRGPGPPGRVVVVGRSGGVTVQLSDPATGRSSRTATTTGDTADPWPGIAPGSGP